jgi:hypothetical protein
VTRRVFLLTMAEAPTIERVFKDWKRFVDNESGCIILFWIEDIVWKPPLTSDYVHNIVP